MAQPRRREENHTESSLCTGHLLVWTWRKMVASEAECPLLIREYEALAGVRADEVLNAISTFLVLLGRGSRRVLTVGAPLCAGVTRDEGQILRLISAAQDGDAALVTAHLSWLVHTGSAQMVRGALVNLSDLLADCGARLPRLDHGAPPPGRPVLEMLRPGHPSTSSG